MKLIVENVQTTIVVGGNDNLLDFDVYDTLRKYLRVRPKGYAQSKLYRTHKWDGWNYFLTPKTGKMATGFLPMVIPYLEELGVDIEIEDRRKNKVTLVADLDDYIGRIDGKDWVGRDYQVKGVEKTRYAIKYKGGELDFPRGVLDYATNAGKNSVGALIQKNVPKDAICVFTVSSTLIYNQALEFFAQVFPDEEIGRVDSKVTNPKRITIAMCKTLLGRSEQVNIANWLNKVNVLIVDEADETGGAEYTKLLRKINAYMRIFVTGTALDGSDKSNIMVTMGHSGKIIDKITNEDLIRWGVSQRPIVNVLLNRSGTRPEIESYGSENERLILRSENRCRLIAEKVLAKHSEEQILITFRDIEHGMFMYNYLREHCHTDIGIVHGTSPDRDEIIQQYKQGKISVLLASTIMRRGANIPIIRVGVIAHGGKSKTDIKQFTGRFTRHDGINDTVTMYDFYDDGPTLGKHSRDRIRIYKGEGFDLIRDYEQKREMPIK